MRVLLNFTRFYSVLLHFLLILTKVPLLEDRGYWVVTVASYISLICSQLLYISDFGHP